MIGLRSGIQTLLFQFGTLWAGLFCQMLLRTVGTAPITKAGEKLSWKPEILGFRLVFYQETTVIVDVNSGQWLPAQFPAM